ncbi:MAG: hypothetical protein WBA97_16735 [Actinophytocola sp.]|uniref:hypothetical protein n=1 Tax=Actinophytocola sp. TaxID=1872138 RepID=UPI003C77F5D9
MGWTKIPGEMVTNIPVAAAVGRDEELFVFAVGTDQRINVNRRTADVWSGWEKLPGETKCAVTAFAQPGGTVIVIHTGMNGKLYQSWWNAGSWAPWESFDGGAGSTTMPIGVAGGSTSRFWFLTGNDRNVYMDSARYVSE